MDLRALINAQPAHARLELPPGEFFGQVVVDRPLTIIGHGKATWIGARIPPVMRITVPGVKLQGLMVELTTDAEGVAIEADPGADPTLEDVTVRGLVVGVPPHNVVAAATAVKEDSIRINFLPPPPMGEGTSGGSSSLPPDREPASRTVPPETATRAPQANSSLVGASQAPITAPRKRPSSPTWRASRWFGAIIAILPVLFLGLVIFFEHREAQTNRSDYIQKSRQIDPDAVVRLEGEKQQLEKEIAGLKQTVKAKALEREQIFSDKLKLEKEVARLKSVEQKARRLREVERQKLELEQKVASLYAAASRLPQPTVPRRTDPSLNGPLLKACMAGAVQTARDHLMKGADPNAVGNRGATALMIASAWGHIDVVKVLLDYGAEVAVKDFDGWTAEDYAKRRAHSAEALFLLKALKSGSRTR